MRSGWTKALFYLAVMMPLWSSYLVKIYAWKLILAKEGILTWLARQPASLLAARRGSGDADDRRSVAVDSAISAPSWSSSISGCPIMILPMQAALERVPVQLHRGLRRSRRRSRGQTFRTVIFPLALPGIVAGSIFTFSLTLGDYIIPQHRRQLASHSSGRRSTR